MNFVGKLATKTSLPVSTQIEPSELIDSRMQNEATGANNYKQSFALLDSPPRAPPSQIRSSRRKVLFNPLLDTISAIEDYCDYEELNENVNKFGGHFDSDNDIGYVGSNSIDSGYKSSCPTPEISDPTYYAKTTSRINLWSTSQSSMEHNSAPTTITSKPRIAMGTKVMSRQDTSQDVRLRHDSGFDDVAKSSDGANTKHQGKTTCYSSQCNERNSSESSGNAIKLSSGKLSASQLRPFGKRGCDDGAVRPRSASIGSSHPDGPPSQLDCTKCETTLKSISGTCSNKPVATRKRSFTPPALSVSHRRRSPSPTISRRNLVRNKKKQQPLQSSCASAKRLSTAPNCGNRRCEVERQKPAVIDCLTNELAQLRPAPSTASSTAAVGSSKLGDNKGGINGTRVHTAQRSFPAEGSYNASVARSTFSHRPTHRPEKTNQTSILSVISKDNQQCDNAVKSSSEHQSCTKSSCVSDVIEALHRINTHNRVKRTQGDSNDYHTYEEVMYTMMPRVGGVAEAKASPQPPPLPERPSRLKLRSQPSLSSYADTQSDLLPSTVQGRPAKDSRDTVTAANPSVDRATGLCHQAPKQRHNLYSLFSNVRERRCIALSLQQSTPAPTCGDEEYGFLIRK